EGELDERGGADALCRQAGQRLLAVCAALEPRRTARSNRRLDGVVEFINENYARPDISLSMLADRFNLTQTYLSHAYKEHTGVNISGYIERLRIERAQQLLREGRTLEQTAFDVGYGHVYSFRTAFKRVTGVTPGAYRDGCAAGGAGEADRG
ncbi:MAG: helix-turn-helix domain-containing protein, partial [Candidatus Fimadaptatus sp.]